MEPWHINPFPSRVTPVDWTGLKFSADNLKFGDYWRVGRITITVRSGDFHAHIDGDRAQWSCGRTVAEAIGSLILSHPDLVSTQNQIIERTAALASRAVRRPDIAEKLRELE